MGELEKKAPPLVLLLFLLVFVFVTVSGCRTITAHKTYLGEDLPKGKVAYLRDVSHYYVFSFCHTNLETINGKDVTGRHMLELLPGSYEVSFSLEYTSYGGSYRPGLLKFQAEAGHVYKLDVAKCASTPRFQAWIEDETTGKVVAGTTPYETQRQQ